MGKLSEAIKPVSGLQSVPASVAPREPSSATRVRVLGVGSILGLVCELVGWFLVTMNVFADGEPCGTSLSRGRRSDPCDAAVSTFGSIGALLILAGLGLLLLALRQVWMLTERLRS